MKAKATAIKTRTFSTKGGDATGGIRFVTKNDKNYLALADACVLLNIFKSSKEKHCRSDNAKRCMKPGDWIKSRVSYVSETGTKHFKYMIFVTKKGLDAISERSTVTYRDEFLSWAAVNIFRDAPAGSSEKTNSSMRSEAEEDLLLPFAKSEFTLEPSGSTNGRIVSIEHTKHDGKVWASVACITKALSVRNVRISNLIELLGNDKILRVKRSNNCRLRRQPLYIVDERGIYDLITVSDANYKDLFKKWFEVELLKKDVSTAIASEEVAEAEVSPIETKSEPEEKQDFDIEPIIVNPDPSDLLQELTRNLSVAMGSFVKGASEIHKAMEDRMTDLEMTVLKNSEVISLVAKKQVEAEKTQAAAPTAKEQPEEGKNTSDFKLTTAEFLLSSERFYPNRSISCALSHEARRISKDRGIKPKKTELRSVNSDGKLTKTKVNVYDVPVLQEAWKNIAPRFSAYQ